MVTKIAQSPAWLREASALVDAGYTRIDLDRGILPAIFRRDGCADLYLFYPTIGGVKRAPYKIEIVGDFDVRPADFSKPESPVLYVPNRLYVPAHKPGYAWLPRLLSQKPDAYTIRSAAEHLGISMVMIEYACCKPNTVPLKSSLNVPHRKLFTESDLTNWYQNKPGRGRRGGDQYSHRALNQMDHKKLVARLKRFLVAGNIQASDIVTQAQALGIAEIPADLVGGEWGNVKRRDLIKLMSLQQKG